MNKCTYCDGTDDVRSNARVNCACVHQYHHPFYFYNPKKYPEYEHVPVTIDIVITIPLLSCINCRQKYAIQYAHTIKEQLER